MTRHPALRLRLGVGLFAASWLPIPQICIWAFGLTGDTAETVRLVGWGIEFVVGIFGLILAGAAAKAVVHRVGWRRLPGTLWSMFRTGHVPPGAVASPAEVAPAAQR